MAFVGTDSRAQKITATGVVDVTVVVVCIVVVLRLVVVVGGWVVLLPGVVVISAKEWNLFIAKTVVDVSDSKCGNRTFKNMHELHELSVEAEAILRNIASDRHH